MTQTTKFDTMLLAFPEKTKSINELYRKIPKLWQPLCRNYYSRIGSKQEQLPNLVSFDMHLSYSTHIPNLLYCPQNGQVNSWQVDSEPRGYPGFYGRISFQTDQNLVGSGIGIFDSIRIYCQTGDGGYMRYNWHCIMFLDDWPRIKQEMVVNILKHGKKHD